MAAQSAESTLRRRGTPRVAGIAVISNPHSRRNQRHLGLSEEMRRTLGKDGLVIETQSVAEIDGAVERILAREADVLAVNGGDGTLHYVVTKLVPVYAKAGRELPLIALLRGGTMNTISKGMKTLPGDPLGILETIAAKYRAGGTFSVAERHALDLNDGEQLGFLFGIGLPASFLQAYYEGETRGPLKGAYVLGRLVLSTPVWGRYARRVFHRVRAFIAAAGEESPYENYTAIFASTVTEIGLGFELFARTLEKEDHFLLLGGALSPVSYVAQLARIYSGAPLQGAMFDRLTREATIRLEGDYPYMFDGDVKTGLREFRLKCGPRLKFIKG